MILLYAFLVQENDGHGSWSEASHDPASFEQASLSWLGTSVIIASVVLAVGGVVCAWLLSRNRH